LLIGTSIAQAIPVAASPILTRMYSPSDFGVLAVFLSLSVVFGTIAASRYELAIMLPDSDEDVFNIAAVGFISVSTISLILLLVVSVFNLPIVSLLMKDGIDPNEMGFCLYFLPVSVFFIGLFNLLNYMNNRKKRFKAIAFSLAHKSMALVSVQIGFRFFSSSFFGLILGDIVSRIAVNIALIRSAQKAYQPTTKFSKEGMRDVAFRYRKFPFLSMPASLANTLSQNLPTVLISTFFSLPILGFYSLAQRVLGLPSSLIGRAVSQAFIKQATSEMKETGSALKAFDSTSFTLLLLSVPVFLGIYFAVEDLFAFVYGEQWRIAGTFAKILVPFYGIRFIVSAISTCNVVFEKQSLDLYWQIGLLTIIGVSFLVATLNQFTFQNFLFLFSTLCSLHYILLFFILRYVASGKTQGATV